MPPILNKIIKNIVRNSVISYNVNNKKLHRRQDGFDNTTDKDGVKPSPVVSIPTITVTPGPATFTFDPAAPTGISATGAPTNIDGVPDGAPVPTDIDGVPDGAPDGAPVPTDINAPTVPAVPAPTPSGTVPIDTDVPPTITSTDISGLPITTQTQIPLSSSSLSTSPLSTTTSSSSPPPIPGSSNNKDLNNLLKWLIPVILIPLLIIILVFIGFIYKKRKRRRNTINDVQNIGAGDTMDKNKENGSKTNSLTSSIHSISSFKIKKGKVAPGEINVGSPVIVVNNNNDNVEEKPKMPMLKRTPTTVSAFKELVDLTEDESNSLRLSLNNTPTSSSNAVNVIPLHQERINVIIPFSIVNQSGGGGSGSRTFVTSNDDDDGDDDDDDDDDDNNDNK